MSRRNTAVKRPVSADPVYNSRLLHMMISHILKEGKKALAYRLMYDAMKRIEQTTQQDPMQVVEDAVRHATPTIEVKARRVGGSIYQVPLEVNPERGTALALRWILLAARNRSGRDMVSNLSNELIDASNRIGNAVRKRDEMHRMAEANKAFAHLRI
jgi:small subunit ribosomal protein S7